MDPNVISAATLSSFDACPMRAAIQVGKVKKPGVPASFGQNRIGESVGSQSGRIAHATARRYLSGEQPHLWSTNDPAHRSADRAFEAGIGVLDEIKPRVLYLERPFRAEVGGVKRTAKPDIVAEAADGGGLEIIEIKAHRGVAGWPKGHDRAAAQLAFFAGVVSAHLRRPVTVLSVVSLAYGQYRSVSAQARLIRSEQSRLRGRERRFADAAATSTWPTKPSPEACGDCPIANTCADAFAAPVEGNHHDTAVQIPGAA